MKRMYAQTRPRFILSSEGVFGGMEFEPMLTPREKSPLPKMSPEEDRTRDAVDSEPKHYQLSYSGPPNITIRNKKSQCSNNPYLPCLQDLFAVTILTLSTITNIHFGCFMPLYNRVIVQDLHFSNPVTLNEGQSHSKYNKTLEFSGVYNHNKSLHKSQSLSQCFKDISHAIP